MMPALGILSKQMREDCVSGKHISCDIGDMDVLKGVGLCTFLLVSDFRFILQVVH